MSFVNSPNMLFPIPTVANEPGPQYATDVNQALYTLDSHNHSPGQGIPIGSQGINLLTDLTFNVNNATNLRSVRFVSTTASSGTDIGCVYVKGVDLFYNDLNANVVRLTLNGGLATTGIFVGVISTTAIISSNAGTPASSGFIRMDNNTDFVSWRNAASNADDKIYFDSSDDFVVAGNPSGGVKTYGVKLFDEGTAKSVYLHPVSGTSSYTFSLPPNPPNPPAFLAMNTSGGMTTKVLGASLTAPAGVFPGSSTMINVNNAVQFQNNAFLSSIGDNCTLQITNSSGTVAYPLVVSEAPSTHGLKIVRGGVNSAGTLTAGEGFSPSKFATGNYTIVFTQAFGDTPVIIASGDLSTTTIIMTTALSTSGASVITRNTSNANIDQAFTFVAMGQRAQ